MPAHEQTRLRSPYTLSIRPTAGQNLWSCNHLAGNAACSREYEWSHLSDAIISAVWGEFLRRLFCLSAAPDSIDWISPWMAMRASQNRSSSSLDSLSVGSTMMVPGTGQEMVGAWKP